MILMVDLGLVEWELFGIIYPNIRLSKVIGVTSVAFFERDETVRCFNQGWIQCGVHAAW